MTLYLMSLLLVSAASPGSGYQWDFESSTIEGLERDDASLTQDPGLVIHGQGSLIADTRHREREWNQCLCSMSSRCPLRPNTSYTIALRYRAIEPLGERVFYLLLRTPSAGGDDRGDEWGGRWQTFDRDVHTKNFVLRTGEASDYFLIFGIKGRGAVVIDDLKVFAGSAPPTGQLARRAFAYEKTLPHLERTAQQTGTAAWMDVIQLLFDPGGYREPDGGYDMPYLVGIRPDLCAYLRRDKQEIRDLGLPKSGMGIEYQELYERDVREASWAAEVEKYRDSMSIGLDGEPLMDPTWHDGGYYVCHSNESWHQRVVEETREHFEDSMALAQDNVGVPALWKANHAFCQGCQSRFRRYLKQAYSPESLREWGIEDLDRFDVREFILEHSLRGRDALRSPVVREYIKNYHLGQLEAWMDLVRHIRQWTIDRADGPYNVFGNLIGAMGADPYAAMVCPWVDMVWEEHWWPSVEYYKWPRFNSPGYGYKLGGDITGWSKPVFILDALEEQGRAAYYLTSVEQTFAEGLANGGYRVFSPGANIPRYQGMQPIRVPGMVDLHIRYAGFVRAHRGLFWGRRPAHRAAVVYSIPTHMFHRFPAVPGLDDRLDYWRFAGACVMMEHAGIPYDVLVLPHPELVPDNGWRHRMTQYDLLVLPGVKAMAPEQIEAAKDLMRRGGAVLAMGTCAEVDENYNPYPRGVFEPPLQGYRQVGDWDLAFGRSLWDRQWPAAAMDQTVRLLNDVYPAEKRQIAAVRGRDTVVNLWEDKDERFFSLHLLNYDWDVEKDCANALENLAVGVEVPQRYRRYAPVLLTFEGGRPQVLKQTERAGRTWITIPRLNVYAIVVWGDSDYIRAKTDYAAVFNLAVRLHAMGEALPDQWWDKLPELWQNRSYDQLREYHRCWEESVKQREAGVLNGLK